MHLPKLATSPNLFSRLFSDRTLTQKASLNAITSVLEYVTLSAVALVVTPLLVIGLGNYFYGIWQFLNRVIGYMTPTSGQPTVALKYILAHQQESTDYENKRHLVGSAIIVWAIFLPLLGVLGGLLAWYLPIWLNVLPDQAFPIRLCAILLVSNLAMQNLAGLPVSILQGENLGYKRIAVSTVLFIMGGMLTWLALQLHTGLPGIATALLIATVLSGSVLFFVARMNTPWFGIARPKREHVMQFLSLSGWFWIWNIIASLMFDSDVVVLGIFNSIELITTYTLNKYVPDAIMSMTAMVVISIAPGMGGIIGSGDLKRASKIRDQLMALTWIIATVAGTCVLLWNRAFISLWVGPDHYAGALPSLLIVVALAQFVFIRNDANIIDLTLNLRRKVIIGSISVALTIALSSLFYGYFHAGLVGLLGGLILGRLVLTVTYPVIMGRFFRDPFFQKLKGLIRQVLITAILFVSAVLIQPILYVHVSAGIQNWFGFLFCAVGSALVLLVVTFYGGLPYSQRKELIERIQMIVQPASHL